MPGTSVFVDIVGRDMASPAFVKAGRAAETSATKMNAAFRSTLVMGAKLAGGFAAFEVVKKAIDIGKEAAAYQRQMLLIRTQTGASTAELKNMSKAVLGLAGPVATSPLKLAQSLYHFESIGQRGAAALHDLRIAAEGAKIGNADLEDTTNALTYTLQSGITGVKGLSQAMGVFNTIVGSGDMTMQQLVEAIGAHGLLANAKASGASIQEVGAALAVLGDNGVKGVNASTALIQVFNDFLKPAQGGAAALDAIGLSATRLRNDMSQRGLNSALQDLNAHFRAAGVTGTKLKGALADIFTKRASANLAILMGNMDLWNTKLKINTRGAHNFGSAWEQTTHTTSFVFQRLGSELDAYGISLANKVMPPLTEFVDNIGTKLPGAVHTAQSILTPFASFTGNVLTAGWHTLGTAVTLVGDALGPVVSLINDLRTPLGAIGTAAIAAYAGFKLFSAVPALMETVYLKVLYARDSVVGFGVAAKTTATNFVASSAVIAGTADATATDIAAAGTAARVGWAGILGPIGAIAIGVGALVTMFHRSSSASKEATDAAKAYSDALSGGGDKTTIVDAIRKQLVDNDVPGKLQKLNNGLIQMAGLSRVSGSDFLSAIQSGGKPLDAVRKKLEAADAAYQKFEQGLLGGSVGHTSQHFENPASRLLKDLNTQYSILTKTAVKDLQDTKTFAGVSSSIDKVSASTRVGSDLAKQYAQMMGIVVDKNGIAAVSSKTLQTAVSTVRSAYAGATASGQAFLSALDSFSQSAGTAADRAALIGSTLKAANGEALDYVSQMNAAAVASHTFASDIRSAAKSVGKNGESTRAYLKSVVDLKNGTIDYHKAAAAPLINDLEGIQSAAMNAAQAAFTNARATMSGKDAADQAYKVYKSQTSGQLIDQLTKLTGNAKAAHALAREYFGMPKNVKTLIEAQGTNPIVTVLNKIGRQLSILTKTPWNANLDVNTQPAEDGISGIQGKLRSLVEGHYTAVVSVVESNGIRHGNTVNQHRARGGPVRDGYFTVGEEGGSRGWELGEKRGSSLRFWSNRQSKAMTGWDRVPGFASGTGGPITTTQSGGKKVWVYKGIQYASYMAAHNAETRDTQKKSTGAATSSAIGRIGGSPSSPIDLSTVGIARVWAQIRKARQALRSDIADGLGSKAAARFRGQIHRMVHTANREFAHLQVKIRTSDLHALTKALKGSASDTRAAFGQLFSDLRHANAPGGVLSALGRAETGLVANQKAIAAQNGRLDKMTTYRSGIRSTLAGAFDPTTFGSVQDLLYGLHSATGTNNRYASEVSKLRRETTKGSALRKFINRLAASGQTTTLATLAGASRSDLRNVAKDVGAYDRSLAVGSDAATTAKFNESVKQQHADVDRLVKAQHDSLRSLHELAVAVAHIASTGPTKAQDKRLERIIGQLDGHVKAARRSGSGS